MKNGMDIYNYPRQMECIVKAVKKADISEKNKKIIFEFKDFLSLDGISFPRIIRYLWTLKDWAKLMQVDFDKATKEDIIKAVRILQENDNLRPWTKTTYKAMLKRFYKWIKKTDNHPDEVSWIKAKPKRTEREMMNNGDLFTEQEVMKLINLADHPRDKALVSVLYESGARVGEIASLQIGNIKFDEYGVILNVIGKTGARHIRIISSTPYLSTWLQNHPFRNDNNAPLWINVGTTKHHEIVKYCTITSMLQRLFKRAEIKKRCNPHMFRHSRATFLADHLTEFQMNQYFGWIQGSNMPSTYVHMSGKEIDSSILALNGIKSKESSKEIALKPKICSRCDTINAVDSKFCCKCAGILDIKTAYELQEKTEKEKEIRKNSDNVLNTLMKDPEFVAVFVNKMRELGLTMLH